MCKVYTVESNSNGVIPPFLTIRGDPSAIPDSGPVVVLHKQGEKQLEIAGAGKREEIIFTTDGVKGLYTKGMMNCFAFCALWEEQGGYFTRGLLAHVSSTGPSSAKPLPRFQMGARGGVSLPPGKSFFEQVMAQVPKDANIIIGTSYWLDELQQKLTAAGFDPQRIWIYLRRVTGPLSFAISHDGAFGEAPA